MTKVNDLDRATALARQMVCLYGMSETIGLAHCAERQGVFLAARDGTMERDCREATASKIDDEVKRLLDDCYAESRKILSDHRDQLDLVAGELLRKESLDAATFQELIGQKPEAKLSPAAAANLHPAMRATT